MLSDNSKEIIENLFNKNKIKKINCNDDSINWLTVLFNKIKSLKMSKLEVDQITECSKLGQEKEYNNIFVDKSIQDDIKTNQNCHIYKILNTTIIIGDKYLDKINLKHIANIVSIMRDLSGDNNHIRINIWNTPFKKNLPHNCSKLQPLNINSGSTLPGYFVNLWRHEEINKVLIHELVHTFFLDFRDNGKISPYIRETFGITSDSPVYIWESYTEYIAIIIHSIYISKTINDVINMLSVEKYFGYIQTAKILKHFGCNTNDDLISKNCKLSYSTDSLSYFYIKTALLHNLDKSILFMKDNNNNLINFNDNAVDKYLELIKLTTTDPLFIQKINKYINDQNNSSDSLRMSALEIN
jgi:hypothetical protein